MTNELNVPNSTPAPIKLREIGRRISDALNKVPENDAGWVAVIGEDSMIPVPVLEWTQAHADSILQVVVSDGHSEGHLLYVQAMPNRYEPSQVECLFRIKLLCGRNQAYLAARDVDKYLQSSEFQELVDGRAAQPEAPSQQPPAPLYGPMHAAQFMDELQSTGSLMALADKYGARTLVDLFYLHSAIMKGGFVDHYPTESAVLEVIRDLPSGGAWEQFVKVEYTTDPLKGQANEVRRDPGAESPVHESAAGKALSERFMREVEALMSLNKIAEEHGYGTVADLYYFAGSLEHGTEDSFSADSKALAIIDQLPSAADYHDYILLSDPEQSAARETSR